jgi:hypothetical protein
MKGNQLLGVLYGGNPIDLLNPQNQIFARWLQKRVVITDASSAQYTVQGGYGPDRQWFTVPQPVTVRIAVYSEDGVTPLGAGSVSISPGQVYQLVLTGG